MTYVIEYDTSGYTPRGAAKDLIYSHDREVLIEGPSETGKTLAACWKVHLCACKYPGAQIAVVRKTYKSMAGSVLQTLGKVISSAVESGVVDVYGGEKPEKYLYKNGSILWVGGMDNPDKVLSSERDMAYYNQAEESTIDEWEKLITRTTGRGAVMPYTQLLGDANPAGSKHYLVQRRASGRLTWLHSTHQDNPTLYMDGELTEYGKRVMNDLSSLTGIRRKRLYEGIWATAEGAVYDNFDHAIHVKERLKVEMVRWYLCQDEGYTNPAVILLVGEDGDGRWHIFSEWYERGKLQGVVVTWAKRWAQEYNITLDAVDESAAGLIADLKDNGIPAQGAKGRVLDGIQAIHDKLAVQGDNLPRLTVDPSCANTINEFESYVWKPEKDEPIKENDHAMDAIRYLHAATVSTWYSF